jgi:hypothetical protein
MRRLVWLSIMMIAAACAPATSHQASQDTKARPGFTDSSFVRRMCVAPDSVLRGDRPCLVQDQADRRVFP